MKHFLLFLWHYLYMVAGYCQVLSATSANWLQTPITYNNEHNNILAVFQQPAALAFLKKSSIASIGTRPYFMPALFAGGVTACGPLKTGGWAAGMSYLGNKDYNVSGLVLGYARSLNLQIKLGASFQMYQQRIRGYGSDVSMGFNIGTVWTIEKNCYLHMQVENPFPVKKLSNPSDALLPVYKAGILYEWSSYFQTGIEFVKSHTFPLHMQGFLQYAPNAFVFLKAGFNSGNLQYFFCTGFIYQQLRLDVSVMVHPQLGASPVCMIVFFPKSNAK